MFKKIWQSKYFFWTLIIFALAIRVYGMTTQAQPYDIGTYQAWGNHLLANGSLTFFDTIWSDYLPLPILTFAIPSYLSATFTLDFSLVFKLFNTLIELILIYLIGKNFPYPKIRNSLFIILLLSPATIANTSFWGQVDAIPSLLTLFSLITLINYNSSSLSSLSSLLPSLAFGLAVAYKPIMILLAPILWVVAIKKGQWWQFPLFSSMIFFASAIPFVSNFTQIFGFLSSRIFDQAGTYPYLTINGWNLWSLVPNNTWLPDTTSVLGVSGHTFGLLLFASIVVLVFNHWRKSKFNLADSYLIASIIMLSFYTFTTRMHERHLLFGLPFLVLAALYKKSLLIPYILYTIFYTLNLYSAFSWVINSQTWPFDPWVTSLVSWGTVLTTLTLIVVYLYPRFLSYFLSHLKSHKLLIAILFFATLLRTVNLSHPQAYIFDEVYHAFTAKEYLHNHIEAWEWWTTPPPGVAYEWTHPPVAKYGMVAGMLLFGENEFGYRLGSAVMGIISILGIYLLTSNLFKNKQIALLASLLVSIEGTHLVQSRIAMNDTYMLAFFVWSLYAAIKSRWKASALLYGLALGSKWSALYGVVPLSFIYIYQELLPLRSIRYTLYSILYALRILTITLITYILTFAPFILGGHTWAQWWELHRQMWYYHTHLVATHGYQSTPLQWIVGARPVWYWVEYGQGIMSNIYVHANPLILWLGLVALILQLKKVFQFPYTIIYTLYTILVLPWLFSPRIMFYYHYLPSATFLCVVLATWLYSLPVKYRFAALLLCFVSLLLISPMLYGFPMPQSYWNILFTLFPSWK